jgi:broad specificity phosphatase PhoE
MGMNCFYERFISEFERRILFSMKLLLIRHGEIPSNINKIYAGTSSEGLTERGLAQAKEIADILLHYKIDALYASPVYRAFQTAQIIGETIGKDVRIDAAFREIEMGPWEGLSEKEVAQTYPKEWQIWMSKPAELKVAGREMLDQLLNRVLKGVRNLYQSGNDKAVVVVTHVAVIRVLLLWHEKKSLNLYKTIHIPNAEVFELNIDS